MKECSKCHNMVDETHFHRKNNGYVYPYCKDCHREYVRDHYNKNKKYYIDKSHNHTLKIREWFADYKSKLKCEKCGETHPSTLDFHHIEPSEKEECISILVSNGSLKKLQKEISKCKVLCANCHRKFHFENASVV